MINLYIFLTCFLITIILTVVILKKLIPYLKSIKIGQKILEAIEPVKDVDGFTSENFYKLAHNMEGLKPCTPKGIIELLKYYDIPLSSQDVCIIGRGNIVGKPLLFEFLNENATVTICHSKTKDLKKKTVLSLQQALLVWGLINQMYT